MLQNNFSYQVELISKSSNQTFLDFSFIGIYKRFI